MPDLNDHDLLIRIDERVQDLAGEMREVKTILVSSSKRVSNLEGQLKAVWFIFGGGGIVGGLIAGLLALLGRKG